MTMMVISGSNIAAQKSNMVWNISIMKSSRMLIILPKYKKRSLLVENMRRLLIVIFKDGSSILRNTVCRMRYEVL